MWCTRDGSSKYLSRPIGRDFAFNSVAFSPDGRYVAGGHDDQHLRIWAARTGHLLQKWEVHSEDLISVAFRPDGKRLASAGGGPEYAWRNSNVSSLQGQLPYSEHMVNDEEDFICTGHTVRFLSHFQLVVLYIYKGTIYSISFSPDGQWVLTSSLDHTSRIWEATTGAWVCSLTRHTAFVGASDFSPIGDYLVTGGGDGRVVLWKYREVEE
jgi:WD40 repeat protein